MAMSECWAGPAPGPAVGFVLIACYISRPGSGLMMSNKDNMNPLIGCCAQLTKPVNGNNTNLGVVSLPNTSFTLQNQGNIFPGKSYHKFLPHGV